MTGATQIGAGHRVCLAFIAAADALKLGFVHGVAPYVHVQRVRRRHRAFLTDVPDEVTPGVTGGGIAIVRFKRYAAPRSRTTTSTSQSKTCSNERS
jgi:hypothetical protein